jgi:hypothetical protein
MKNFTKTILILGTGFFLLGEGTASAQKDSVFSYTGSMQTWTVPPCVGKVIIEVKGAQGGTGATYSSWPGGTGGLGADAKATYTVSSGTILYIYVGGQALFNGGGAAVSYGGGGNGGDASDVRIGGVALANRVIVAGGGGGGGAEGYGNSYTNNNGGDGGAAGLYGHVGMPGSSQGGNTYVPGQNGNATGGGNGGLGYYDGGAGGGGGADGGGAGGNTCSYCSFTAGAGGTGGACGQSPAGGYDANGGCLGVGGTSTYTNSNGGGGGGGYYGGGGGSPGNGNQWAGGGGGGGGSSYTGAGTSVTVIDSAISGNGSVIITWFPDSLTSVSGNIIANVSCHGGNDAKATAVATGGSGKYTYTWAPGGGTSITQSGLTAGVYTITASDSCGSSRTATVTITEPTALSLTKGTKFVGVTNCNGVAYVTAAGGTAPYTYAWSPGGATSDTVKALCNGSYCCTVTDKNGCIDSVCVNIVTAGIAEISNTDLIKVFPDPNNGIFTISGLAKGFTVELYNYMGEKINSNTVENTTAQFNISPEPNGIYLVRIISKDGKLIDERKLIKSN